MDTFTAATKLREHLIRLQSSDNNIHTLEQRQQWYGAELLRANLCNNLLRQLQMFVRLSVCEGMLRAYREYSYKKWSQVQSLARPIKSSLEVDDSEHVTSEMTSSSRRTIITPDRTAVAWCETDMDLYRRD